MLLPGKRNGVLRVTGRETLRRGIVRRESRIGRGMIGSTDTGKRRMAIESTGIKNVTWVTRMTGTGDTLPRDLGADRVQFQKRITGLDQGMQIMGSAAAYHQSDTLMHAICSRKHI